MHYTRIAAFFVGAWLLGSVFQAFVATRNFRVVDSMLRTPPAEATNMLQKLGPDESRQLLRYVAGEENREMFEIWEVAQLAIGAALTALLLFGVEKRLLAGLAGAMLALTLFQHLKITPDLVALGRLLDFRPANAEPQMHHQFWRLHGIYGGIEVAKMLLALTISGFLFAMRSRRSTRRIELDPVDYINQKKVSR